MLNSAIVRGLAVLGAVLSLSLPSIAHAAEDADRPFPQLKLLTEDWKPYQFYEDGQLSGIAVDILIAMLHRAGSTQGREDISMLPWARAYRTLRTQPNTVLFSTTRIKSREQQFKWVGPISKNETYLIGKKGQSFKLDTPNDRNAYYYGAIVDDASELFLKELGVNSSQIVLNTKAANNVKMMDNGRIDFVVTGKIAFVHDAAQANVDPDLYEGVYLANSSEIAYALNKETPDWIVNRLQGAFDDLYAEGIVNTIFAKYQSLLLK